MGELDEGQQARLFDALLNDAEKWNTAPRAQARRAADADEAVAEDLALIVEMREMQLPRSETEFARARVGQRLADMMRAEPGPQPTVERAQGARAWLRAVTAPPHRVARATAPQRRQAQRNAPVARPPMSATLRRLSAFVAVAMALLFVSLAGASIASAHALPESPFYSVKRAEEATLLALAWNDDSKGQTLAMIAHHRITEAVAEAEQGHSAEAHTLLGEFDTALSQLIDLTAHAQAIHENAASLTNAVQMTLEAERNAAAQAAAHGETAFAAAANASAQAASDHIQRVGVDVPAKSGQSSDNSKGPGQSNSSSSGKNTGSGSGNGNNGKPQQTPGANATHTPHTGPSNGSGG